ncbi:MAG: ribose-phosphate diphosphokinase, partial [Candidatus Magasanikbacteria bacterium]|nr:ribose-phosphate diphosphokinase [Candidatus Magasanikbacteria bacterium]
MGFRAVKVFATTGSEELAQNVCRALERRLPANLQPTEGLLGKVEITRFSNDNLMAKIDNVRGHFVVIIHTQVPPVNDHLIELFTLLDAIENSGAEDVLLVFPYMPYARSDRKNQPRISTMAPRLAHIFVNSFGIRRVLLLDPHDGHTKHFFTPAADEISALYLLADYIKTQFFLEKKKEECAIVFADAGAAKRFGHLAHLVSLPVAYIDKDRPDNGENPDIKKVVGDVRGKFCILIDDEILTGGTVIGDTKILLA